MHRVGRYSMVGRYKDTLHRVVKPLIKKVVPIDICIK